jgi:hypothetical protein
MNIYVGLLFLHGHIVRPEDIDDNGVTSPHTPSLPLPSAAPRSRFSWPRALRLFGATSPSPNRSTDPAQLPESVVAPHTNATGAPLC